MQQNTKIATLDKGIASKVKFAETVTPRPEQQFKECKWEMMRQEGCNLHQKG